MSGHPKNSSVRSSREGDQFHYLWAARECLALLSPTAELVAVAIEGAATSETAVSGLDAGDEVIDIAKYYGDQDLTGADRIVYSQLKHSTVRTDQHWTFSGIERSLSGFAAKYRAVTALPDGRKLASKLHFSFVSNRPVQDALAKTFVQLSAGVTVDDTAIHGQIEKATGLRGTDLQSFCSQFAFDVGQPGYWDQRNLLRQDLKGYLPGPDADAPLQLTELVTRKALPESADNNAITKIDVLRALHSDMDEMFPAPCRIKGPDHPIPREQTADLVREIVATEGVPFIVHAEGGVGKSIFTLSINGALPPGSDTVLYDCFGDGAYRSISGYRHRHRDATVQIANELSSKKLCHPLLQSPYAEGADYIKSLLYRLEQAATKLQAQTPGAVLAIVIDAADNAQMAAEEFGEARSFVVDLIRAGVPQGTRIVFLCRTHRQYMLNPPPGTIARELTPFSLEETKAFLLQSFPGASDRDVAEFHRLSSQNPRVQALALGQGGDLPQILAGLGPNPSTVESTLAVLLAKTVEKVRDEAGVGKPQIDKICAGLATLRPLVPISVLSALSGAPEAAIRSFAYDLGRPLFVSGDLIHFLDEPSETWFREQFKPKPNAMAKFVAQLKPLADRSAYVAAVLPQLMLEAGQLKQLVALALSSESLPGDNPIERRDVELRRLQFALKASLRAHCWVDAAKLSLKAGGETAGDDRQNELIECNTDLAARFLDTDRVQELVSRRLFSASWQGSHNCYEAGLMSYHPALRVEVQSRLRLAEAWLRNYFSTPKDQRHQESLEDDDIAEMAMAIFNISGPARCADWLATWKPKEVAFRIGRLLASRLIDQGRIAELQSLGEAAPNSCLSLAINDELLSISRTCKPELVLNLVRALSAMKGKLKRRGYDHEDTVLSVVTKLVRSALLAKVSDTPTLLKLLERYLPKSPPSGLSSRWGFTRVSYLRGRCLQATLTGTTLVLNDFADEKLKGLLDKEHYQSESDARIFKDTVGRLLPWYQLQADADAGKLSAAALQERVAEAQKASQPAEHHYGEEDRATDDIAVLWLEVLGSNNALTDQALAAFEDWRQNLKRALYPATLIRLSHYLGRAKPDCPKVLDYAALAFSVLRDVREDAESKSRDFISLARAVLSVSAAEAQGYFDHAVTVASLIGQENTERWGALIDLAGQAGKRPAPDPKLAYRLSRCAELTYDFVARDKYFDWNDTIAALVDLSPASALATFSRWQDRRFGDRRRILPLGIEALIARKDLPTTIAIPLFTIQGYWQYVDLLAAALSHTPVPERQKAFDFYWRYLSLESWGYPYLAEVAEAVAPFDLQTGPLQERMAFERIKAKSDRATGRDSTYEAGDPPEEDWDSIFAGLNLIDVSDLMTANARYKASGQGYRFHDFYRQLFDRVASGSEPQVLQGLSRFPDFTLFELRNMLETIPAAWKARIAIKSALSEIIVRTCRQFCLDMTKSRQYQTLPLSIAVELSGIPERDLVFEVLQALGDLPDQFGSRRLFSLNGLLAVMMTPKEAADALSFGLELLEPSLEETEGDGPWKPALAPPNNVPAALAGYLWAGLSSPRAEIRWECAHAVQALCLFDVQAVLTPLVRIAAANTGREFGDERLHFYDLHGTQWLLIGLAKAALSAPTSVAPHVAFLKAQAKRADRHVVIRQFAADALLTLARAGAISLSKTAIVGLEGINTPKLPPVSRDRWAHTGEPRDRADDYTFGIDVGPYWFAPLGRLFGKSQGEISRGAMAVITNDWGIEKDASWREDERYRLKIFQDGETHHSHGSVPPSDDRRFYLGYHAMMIVAGGFLDTEAPTQDRGGWDESFKDWLHGHTLTRSDGRWIADRRDPKPADWPAWKDEKDDDIWQWGIQRADFETMVFPALDKIRLSGEWSYVASNRIERIGVTSALVPCATSAALLRCLQTTGAREYYLPSISENHSETPEQGFEIDVWTRDPNVSKRIDGADPWAGELKFPGIAPGSDIVTRLGLTSDVDSRIWTDAGGEPCFWSEIWTYNSEKDRYRDRDEIHEDGRRFTGSVKAICRYLAEVRKDLIISIKIERSYSHRYGGSKDEFIEYPQPYARVFVISADGIVRSF